jgi:hypothetical protein
MEYEYQSSSTEAVSCEILIMLTLESLTPRSRVAIKVLFRGFLFILVSGRFLFIITYLFITKTTLYKAALL